ncbi:MAG: hypothetical protein IJ630_00190 [Treponema sp.]|nr:hypothetical protein [Treponema sp.]
MAHTPLEKAHSLLRRRKFSHVISILESGNNPEIYRETFDYFLTAGLACLYLGDTGSAGAYFQRARHIRLTDPTLLCAQAVLFLRRGDTEKALSYYIDVLDEDPDNKVALSAIEFIRTHGTDELYTAIDSGEIEKFYPPLGINPDWIKRVILSALVGLALALLILNLGNFSKIFRHIPVSFGKERKDLKEFFLPVEDIKAMQQSDSAATSYKYTLSEEQIKHSYELVKAYSTAYKENAARVEINRLLLSNANNELKTRMKIVLSHFTEPTFDSLITNKDNIDYATVRDSNESELYLDCMVSWSGRIANAQSIGTSYRFDLLVGYENLDRMEGIVPVFFEEAPYPELDGERTVHVLGKISSQDGSILLKGRAVYQEIRK